MLYVHENELPNIFDSDIRKTNQVKWLHNYLIVNLAVLKVSLLPKIELNVFILIFI